jgi:hypothetical protein
LAGRAAHLEAVGRLFSKGVPQMSSDRPANELKNDYIGAFPEGAGELAHWLWSDIAHLHMNWNNYRLLFTTDQETVDLLNAIAASYFMMTERLLRQDTLMIICRITDPPFSDRAHKKPNASLRHLRLRVSDSLPVDLGAKVDSSLEALDELCVPIRDLRDKRFAHSDVDEVLQLKNEPLPGVPPKRVEDVLAKMRDVFEAFEGHFLGSSTAFAHVIQTSDARKLIHHLKRAHSYEEIEKIVLSRHFGAPR